MSDGPNSYEGDLYDSDMGELGNGPDQVHGGNAQFDWHGGGRTHHSVYGDGGHFSWDDPFDAGQYDDDDMDVHGTGFGDYGGG